MKRVLKSLARLYPAEWRMRYGAEYAALLEEGKPRVRDAFDVVWAAVKMQASCLFPKPEEQRAIPRYPFLAGRYVMISQGGLSFFDLARGCVLSVILLVLFGYAETDASQVVESNAYDYGGILHATAARPSFEVASIRPSAPNPESRFIGITMQHPDSIEIRGSSIKDVIEFAYAVPNENEFSGGPSWIQTENFDITAKPSEAEVAVLSKLSATDQWRQMRLMIQSLLEERFQLKVSFAMKQLPLFALTVAKDGFKCKNAVSYSAADPQPPPLPPPPGHIPSAPGDDPQSEQPMHLTVHRMPFPAIVSWIARQPELDGRIVVDKTGLNGSFDCGDVLWSPEGTNAPDPSFFTAIQEQMGLKLQSEKGPVETIIIDHIEHPSEN